MSTDNNAVNHMTGLAPELEALMADKNEPLHPDLLGWVEEHELFGPTLRHPLVYQLPLFLPGMANKVYLQKKEQLEKAVASERWTSVIWLHERPYRLRALVDYCIGRRDDDTPLPLASAPEYWQLTADVWVDSENIEQMQGDWSALFGDCTGFWLGTDEERAEFDALPDPIPAWRGEIDDGGWSYTTDQRVADWFAKRFGHDHDIVEERIPKDRVFGYLTRRGENELLVSRNREE